MARWEPIESGSVIRTVAHRTGAHLVPRPLRAHCVAAARGCSTLDTSPRTACPRPRTAARTWAAASAGGIRATSVAATSAAGARGGGTAVALVAHWMCRLLGVGLLCYEPFAPVLARRARFGYHAQLSERLVACVRSLWRCTSAASLSVRLFKLRALSLGKPVPIPAFRQRRVVVVPVLP